MNKNATLKTRIAGLEELVEVIDKAIKDMTSAVSYFDACHVVGHRNEAKHAAEDLECIRRNVLEQKKDLQDELEPEDA